jgi:hypothetical protein
VLIRSVGRLALFLLGNAIIRGARRRASVSGRTWLTVR